MSHPTPLTAIVIAAGEAANIESCLRTLDWCDELLVVDAFSADGTPSAAPAGTRLVERRFTTFAAQRQDALARAAYDWVFFVDADERVSDALAAEVRGRAGHEAHAAYDVPRLNLIFGHWMRGSGWAPDHQLRVMDRRRVHYPVERAVHEVPDVDGSIGEIEAPLLHHSYRTIREFRRRQRRYARMHARSLYQAGVRRRRTAVVAQPLRELRRRLVEYRGYRDGWVGVQLALLMAEYEWRLQRGLARCWRRGAPSG